MRRVPRGMHESQVYPIDKRAIGRSGRRRDALRSATRRVTDTSRNQRGTRFTCPLTQRFAYPGCRTSARVRYNRIARQRAGRVLFSVGDDERARCAVTTYYIGGSFPMDLRARVYVCVRVRRARFHE